MCAGPGKLLDSGERGAMDVEVGDEVFYGRYAGTEIEFDGEKYVVLRESEILAVVV
jgi:chaperonin GroES